ncbi:MAG: phosphatase PAP2 family protein [Metallibacterium scheffleri]
MSDRVLSCAARRLVGTTVACALGLLLAPAHASADSASAVLHVRNIDARSAVRSVRDIGNTQRNPAVPAHAGIPAAAVIPAQVDTQPPPAVIPAQERHPRASVSGTDAQPPPAVILAQVDTQPSPAVIPAQAGIQIADAAGFPSPTPASGEDVPARERRSQTSPAGSGRPSAYSQPLLASVRQAQQPAPSAVIAQSEIGAGNDILLPRAWYDTTPGRIGIFIGASAVASLADRGVKDWAMRHQNSAFSRDVIKARDILPWPAFWLAAATSFPSPWANDKLAHTSTVALGAGVLDSVETLALKAVIGRDRPNISNNPYNFTSFNPRYSLIYGASSFPSGHTSLTWALITPYARAYHMPWLYALGVASGAGRVMQNAHWFSDVVGGGLLGYFTARWTEEHMNSKANVQWVFTGNGLYMFKSF